MEKALDSFNLIERSLKRAKAFQQASTHSKVNIMKFASTLQAFLCLVPFLVTEVMGGYVILQVLLNNGNSHYCIDRWNNCCTSTEWNLISTKVYAMSSNQRDLEGTSDVAVISNSTLSDNSTDLDVDRDLATSYPRYCANNCAGYATGRCMALNCRGYRRATAESQPSLRPKRDLFYSTSCDNQKSEMNNLLTNIQNELGPRCRSLLNAPRKMSCYGTELC